MQLDPYGVMLLDSVLSELASWATQLQQLQIVTKLSDDARVRVKHLVWQQRDLTLYLTLPPAVNLFHLAAADLPRLRCCAGMRTLDATLPHSSGRLLYWHASGQA